MATISAAWTAVTRHRFWKLVSEQRTPSMPWSRGSRLPGTAADGRDAGHDRFLNHDDMPSTPIEPAADAAAPRWPRASAGLS